MTPKVPTDKLRDIAYALCKALEDEARASAEQGDIYSVAWLVRQSEAVRRIAETVIRRQPA